MTTTVLRSKTCSTSSNFGIHENTTSRIHLRTLRPEPHLFSVTFDSLLSPLSTIPQDCSRHFLDNIRFALPCFIQMHNRVNHLAQTRFGMHVASISSDGTKAAK